MRTPRRHLLLALVGSLALVLAGAASGAEVDSYTATITPTHVKPSTTTTYTVVLTNNNDGGVAADAAEITIPAGFVVDEGSITATTSAPTKPGCQASPSTWEAEISGRRIELKRPKQPQQPASATRLCPSASLTVRFSATSPATEAMYTWATALEAGDDDTFVLVGGQPRVVVDGTAPLVRFASGPADPTNARTATFNFASSEPATFVCRIDGGGFAACQPPIAFGNLGDGAHALTIRATDLAGNVGEASYAWRIDATAPETTLQSQPGLRTTATSATFAFAASEGATFQCQLDGGAFAPCGSPISYGQLARGVHRFAVRAIDALGNVDATPATYEWTVAAPVRRTVRAALFAPASGARITRPPVLRWRAVRGATYYNVQLYRGARKVLTTWPTRTALQLRAQWRFKGRLQRLTPGTYRWYVWPGRGNPAARRYGRLLGTSTFVVTRVAAR